MKDIPTGFHPHFRKSPLTDPWEPLYSKISDETVTLGLFASAQHCNARGLVHGGLISALADNALGLSCAKHHTPQGGLVTISLNLEFLKAPKLGEWMEFVTSHTKIGRSIDFAQGYVTSDGERCANVSASFAVPRSE